MITPHKTHTEDTAAVEKQGNRRGGRADCDEYAVILNRACKDYQQVISPLRGKDNRCALIWIRIIYNYTLVYNRPAEELQRQNNGVFTG